jgi:hypothetical protein
MMPIEALRLLVLGIHDKRVDGNLRPIGAVYRIPQKGASEVAAMIGESDRQASEPCDGNGRIAGQTLGKGGGHLREEDAARGQCVVSGNSACRDLTSHKTGCGAAANILASLMPKIPVERINPAGKLCAIVAGRESLNDE